MARLQKKEIFLLTVNMKETVMPGSPYVSLSKVILIILLTSFTTRAKLQYY